MRIIYSSLRLYATRVDSVFPRFHSCNNVHKSSYRNKQCLYDKLSYYRVKQLSWYPIFIHIFCVLADSHWTVTASGPAVRSELSCIFLIVCHTFCSIATQVFIVEPNGDHHENHEEILHKSGGGDISKKFWNFLCIRPLSYKL